MYGIDLFAGAGGMTLGAHLVGVKTLLAVEKDFYAAETFVNNFKETNVVVDDISNIKEIDISKHVKSKDLILYGGPPCQGFSTSNQKTRSESNPSNWLFKEFLRITKLTEPEWVIIENVKGLINTKNGFFIKQIIEELHLLGYVTNYSVLNAMEYGVPQYRDRVFIVGSKSGKVFNFPISQNKEIITVRDAIHDLPFLENGNKVDIMEYKGQSISNYAEILRNGQKIVTNNILSKNSELVLERYKHIPQGGNWENIPKELMENYKDYTRCHQSIYRRLDENQPAFIINNFRKNMTIHPFQDRGLSVREAARIQSFPDWFKFSGPLTSQQQQVANAVPPLLAKTIFERILELK